MATARTCPNASLAVNCFQVANGCFRIPRLPSMLPLPVPTEDDDKDNEDDNGKSSDPKRGCHESVSLSLSLSSFPYANWMEALVARTAQAEVEAEAEAADNKSNNKSNNKTPTLRDLVLPGSHDSATHSIPASSWFSAVGITQNASVGEQLLRGIRFLDLRIASAPSRSNTRSCRSWWRRRTTMMEGTEQHGDKNDSSSNDLFIYHGCLRGGSFRPVLTEVRTFCERFPGEFVVLLVAPEYGQPLGVAGKQNALETIRSVLGDRLFRGGALAPPSSVSASASPPMSVSVSSHPCPASSSSPSSSLVSAAREALSETPLADLIGSHQQICVLLSERFYEGGSIDESLVATRYHCFPAHRFLRDKWHNTRDPEQLLRGNLDEVLSHSNSNKNDRLPLPLLNNQFVLTPRIDGLGDVTNLLLGRSSLQPVHLANNGLYLPRRRRRRRQQQRQRQQQQQTIATGDDRSTTTTIPLLHEFWIDHAHLPAWNIVSLDFVDLVPSVVDVLVGLNGVGSLDVLLATLRIVRKGNSNSNNGGSASSSPSETSAAAPAAAAEAVRVVCVTAEVRSRVLRNKCLFLHVGPDLLEQQQQQQQPTIAGDKRAPTESIVEIEQQHQTITLTLVYRATATTTTRGTRRGGAVVVVSSLVLPVDASSVVVLNEHNHERARGRKEHELPVVGSSRSGDNKTKTKNNNNNNDDDDNNNNNTSVSTTSGMFDPGYGGTIVTWTNMPNENNNNNNGPCGERRTVEGIRFGYLEETA